MQRQQLCSMPRTKKKLSTRNMTKSAENLENKTQERISVIRDKLEKKTSQLLDSQSGSSDAVIQALQKEYSERHTEYAREILKRITEV